MTLNTGEQFQNLIARIQPSGSELSRLEANRKHLIAFMTPRVDTSRFLLMGSHSRGTAIVGSDLDLLQVIRKKEVTWGGSLVSSNTLLNNFRALLSSYGRSEVRRDQVAIVISYQGGAQVDLVPGFYESPGVSNYPVYQIPNGLGGWLQASPEAHNAYIRAADERSGGKLKRVVQMIKYWRRCRVNHVRLNSFHLEITLAASGICEGFKTYSQCLTDSLEDFAKREGRALRDPVGVSGLIAASGTSTQRESVAASLLLSAEHAQKAYRAEKNGQSLEASRQWNIVFNGGFTN